jgi:hypothetical protein
MSVIIHVDAFTKCAQHKKIPASSNQLATLRCLCGCYHRAVQHMQYLASSSSREDAIRAEKVNLQQQLETAKAATQL